MKIALDVMGGDFAPHSPIEGALRAKELLSENEKIVLIGNKDLILKELKKFKVAPNTFEIVHASQVIEMGEQPVRTFRKKRDSSISKGFYLLKNNYIDGFASSGNTGAMLVGSIYTIKTISGVIRPCVSSLLPKENGSMGVILDVGVNADCRPDVMYQFAILGSIYLECVFGIKNPKVGLLNIGEEDGKGNLLTQATFELMNGTDDFNFIGNVEGRDIFSDKADVIVSDGFTGNIVLKEAEGLYHIIKKRGLEDEYFKKFNFEKYGGTPILGVNGSVVIGHGISGPEAIKNMILLTKDVIKSKLADKINKALNNEE